MIGVNDNARPALRVCPEGCHAQPAPVFDEQGRHVGVRLVAGPCKRARVSQRDGWTYVSPGEDCALVTREP